MIASAKREQRILQQFGARPAEATRRAADDLLGTENWLKAMLGEYKALQEPALMGKRSDEEALLRKSFRSAAGEIDPWTRIEAATRNEARVLKESWAIGYGYVRRAAGVTPDYLKSGRYELEVAGDRVPARLELAPLYDPAMTRVKA